MRHIAIADCMYANHHMLVAHRHLGEYNAARRDDWRWSIGIDSVHPHVRTLRFIRHKTRIRPI